MAEEPQVKHVHYEEECLLSADHRRPRRDSRLNRLRQSVASFTSSVLPQDYVNVLVDPDAHYRKVLYQVIHLGISFAFIFTATLMSSFFTTLFPDGSGYASLALSQVLFAFGSLVAPVVCAKLGPIRSIFFGAITYPLLASSVNFNSAAYVISIAALNGFGAGLVWIGQGIWLTRLTERVGSIGTFTGIFFTLFNLNGIFANVMAIVLSQIRLNFSFIAWTITGLSAIGALMLIFAKAPTEHKELHVSFSKRVKDLLHVIKMRKTLLITPYIICQGLSLSFTAGNLPVYANGNEQQIIYIQLAFGITATLTSFVCGKIYDRAGMRPLLLIHLLVVVAQYVSLITLIDSLGLPNQFHFSSQISAAGRFAVLTFLGATYGLLDFLINTIVNVSISQSYDRWMPPMFSYFRVASCLAYAGASALSSILPDLFIVILNVIAMVISIVCYWLFQRQVRAEEEQMTPQERVAFLRRTSKLSAHDALRLSVASVACTAPGHPSVISPVDIIAEEADNSDFST